VSRPGAVWAIGSTWQASAEKASLHRERERWAVDPWCHDVSAQKTGRARPTVAGMIPMRCMMPTEQAGWVGQRCQHRHRRWRGVEELAAAGQLAFACAVAEQPVVADALEPIRQDVQQEASDELVGIESGQGIMRGTASSARDWPISCSKRCGVTGTTSHSTSSSAT
jgi:hypothetical protein